MICSLFCVDKWNIYKKVLTNDIICSTIYLGGTHE